jgi:hypothetical protein
MFTWHSLLLLYLVNLTVCDNNFVYSIAVVTDVSLGHICNRTRKVFSQKIPATTYTDSRRTKGNLVLLVTRWNVARGGQTSIGYYRRLSS